MRVRKRHCRYVARAGLGNLLACLLVACSAHAIAPGAPTLDAPRDETIHYQLWFGDSPIGFARERLRETDDGFVLTREERIRVRRNGQPVDSSTVVRISGASVAVPNRIEWTAESGGHARTGVATRLDPGWDIAIDGQPRRQINEAALPWELVAWTKPTTTTPVVFPGLGFVLGQLTPVQNGAALELSVVTAAGVLKTRVRVDERGRWRRMQSGSVVAVRVSAQAKLPARGPEMISDTSIAYAGTPSRTLVLERIERTPPPAFSGQRVRADDNRWLVEFEKPTTPSPALEPILEGEILALRSQAKLTLAVPQHFGGPGPTTGDCTAHAVAMVEALARRGISATVVTGFRADGGKLYRHRWVEVEDGQRRIAVDPSYGLTTLPPGHYLALARHGQGFSDVTLADEVTFAGTQKVVAAFR